MAKGKQYLVFMNHAQQMNAVEASRPGSGGMSNFEGLLLEPGHISAPINDKEEALEIARKIQEEHQKHLNEIMPTSKFGCVVKVIEVNSIEKIENKLQPKEIKFEKKRQESQRQMDNMSETDKRKLEAKERKDGK